MDFSRIPEVAGSDRHKRVICTPHSCNWSATTTAAQITEAIFEGIRQFKAKIGRFRLNAHETALGRQYIRIRAAKSRFDRLT